LNLHDPHILWGNKGCNKIGVCPPVGSDSDVSDQCDKDQVTDYVCLKAPSLSLGLAPIKFVRNLLFSPPLLARQTWNVETVTIFFHIYFHTKKTYFLRFFGVFFKFFTCTSARQAWVGRMGGTPIGMENRMTK